MKYYFRLQFTRINRHISDFGLNPALGYILSVGLFVLGSIYLFDRTTYAGYVLLAIGLSFAFRLSDSKRNTALKSYFTRNGYIQIRIIENAILAIPFLTMLGLYQSFIPALILLVLFATLSFLDFSQKQSFTIPSPFGKHPFEFTVGFRKTYALILSAYFLGTMAIIYSNFNLGVFSQFLLFAIFMSYYGDPEHEYFVWSHAYSAKSFLNHKIKKALILGNIASLPMLLGLSICFSQYIYLLVFFQILASFYLVTILLGKYAAYPDRINLPLSIFIGVSLIFPPLLIAILPYFYGNATNRLQNLLHDPN